METIKIEIDKGDRFYVDYFGYAETLRTTNIPPNFVDNIVVKFPSASIAANNNINLNQDKCQVVLVLPEIQSKSHPDNGYSGYTSCSRQSRSGQTGPLCFRRISDSAENLEYSSPLEALLTIFDSSIEISSVNPNVKILSHSLSDITFCSQGITNPEYFGLIATLPSPSTGTGSDPEKSLSFSSAANCHVFRCSSEQEVADVMHALKSAFQVVSNPSNQKKSHSPNKEHLGPIERLNKLCKEIQNKSFSEAHEILQKFIEIHHAQEHYTILRKIQEAGCETIQEANEIIVSCLLHLAEGKPPRPQAPFSDPPESPSHASPHPQLLLSMTSSADATRQILTTTAPSSAFYSHQNNSPVCPINIIKTVSLTSQPVNQEPPRTVQVSSGCHWQQSNTSTTSNDFVCKSQNQFPENSPMRTMFVNVGNSLGNSSGKSAKSRFEKSNMKVSRETPVNCDGGGGGVSRNSDYNIYSNKKYVGNHYQPHKQLIQPESWRFNILNKVVNTSKAGLSSAQYVRYLKDLKQTPALKMNYLWRKAIVDTMVLIKLNRGKMEDNNEEEAPSSSTKEKQVKQMKADYDEITPCLKEVTKVWDELLMITTSDSNLKVDRSIILEAVKAGVPRKRRGEIWIFLMQQKLLESLSLPSSLYSPPPLSPLLKGFQMMTSTPYKELLKMWTQHQHAILIDLGRTFPGHPYFSTQLGSGQISLFNILKAYSLLDTEVGYCQGISFVAGILLMHIPEERSFEVLKHMMFRLNFRNQYRPDMVHLQIQLYQLSRLLHDYHRDLYSHLEQHEISPTLYAAPWFLTIFASQFPLGFVARVFDLIFLQGCEVVVKVAIVLLGNHKELIKQCDGFESVVEFLKTTLPEMSIIQMERIINQVFNMDISKQLEEYKLEYHVLRDEMIALKHTTTETKSSKKKVPEVQHFIHPMSNQNENPNLSRKTSEVQSVGSNPWNGTLQSIEDMKLTNELLSLQMPQNKLVSLESNTNNTNSSELRQFSPTSNIQKQFSDLLQYCISIEEILNKSIQFLPENLTKEFEKIKLTKPNWLLWNLSDEPQTDNFDILDLSKPIHPPSLSLQSTTCDSQLPPTSYSFWPPSPLSDGGIGCYLDREVEDFIGASMNIFPEKSSMNEVEVHQCQPILRNENSREFKPRRPASNYY